MCLVWLIDYLPRAGILHATEPREPFTLRIRPREPKIKRTQRVECGSKLLKELTKAGEAHIATFNRTPLVYGSATDVMSWLMTRWKYAKPVRAALERRRAELTLVDPDFDLCPLVDFSYERLDWPWEVLDFVREYDDITE